MQNFTTPPGWTDHGVQGLLCSPADWTTIAGFIISNYVAHAFTIKNIPGQSNYAYLSAMFMAFCYPAFGIARAVQTLVYSVSWPFRAKGDPLKRALDQALDHDALCMVVRSSKWKPTEEDTISGLRVVPESPQDGRETLQKDHRREQQSYPMDSSLSHSQDLYGEAPTGILPFKVMAPPWFNPNGEWASSTKDWCGPFGTLEEHGRLIHGVHKLPPNDQYEFVIVPANADIIPLSRPDIDLSGPSRPSASPKSPLSILITLYQICYGTVSLYRARGDQIDLYGYTAFGLTVIPYVVMAIINLLAQLLSNDYPELYMIHSSEMDEATRRGGHFEGVVGALHHAEDTEVDGSTATSDQENDRKLWKVAANSEDRETELFTLEHTQGPQRLTVSKTPETENTSHVHLPCCSIYMARPKQRHKLFNRVSPSDFLQYSLDRRIRDTIRGPILDDWGLLLITYAPLLVNGIAIAINGSISRFRNGSRSTRLQRGFALLWMIFNGFYGQYGQWFLDTCSRNFPGLRDKSRVEGILNVVVLWIAFFTPAIGGMVLAGIEMSRYGSCTRLAS